MNSALDEHEKQCGRYALPEYRQVEVGERSKLWSFFFVSRESGYLSGELDG